MSVNRYKKHLLTFDMMGAISVEWTGVAAIKVSRCRCGSLWFLGETRVEDVPRWQTPSARPDV